MMTSMLKVKEPKVPSFLNLRIFYGGKFMTTNNIVHYVGIGDGGVFVEHEINYKDFEVSKVHQIVRKYIFSEGGYKIWYKRYGKTLANGRKVLVSKEDVEDLLKGIDKFNYVTVYVMKDRGEAGIIAHAFNLGEGMLRSNPSTSKPPKDLVEREISKKLTPRRRISFNEPQSQMPISDIEAISTECQRDYDVDLSHVYTDDETQTTQPILSLRRSPSGHKVSKVTLPPISNTPLITPYHSPPTLRRGPKSIPQTLPDFPGHSKTFLKQGKAICKVKRSNSPSLGFETEDEGVIISDIESDQEGVDGDKITEDLFSHDVGSNILESINKSFENGNLKSSFVTRAARRARERVNEDIMEDLVIGEEVDYDSEELTSLNGYEDENDFPIFNPETDFKAKIVLKAGLNFPNVEVLRRAVQQHSMENHYDYYLLHNGKTRFSAYCVNRCKCKWDVKRSALKKCNCNQSVCNFKVLARKVKQEETIQIRTMILKHTCQRDSLSRKVTSSYLAERYLETWRADPGWHLEKGLQSTVRRELGVFVSYQKCWYARAKAKMILYGDGSDQYRRIWDYAEAVKKYNEGSLVIVCVDRIDRPPPIFQRFFVCLKPVIDGFLRGCRPIVGLDGCHLQGSYPGVCLTAVGKDGNNNIYPIAWAVVDAENLDTWTWFIDLLASCLRTVDGDGWTFISDRQKGLLLAFQNVVPKAETRYCWRHLWCNFKEKHKGEAFKNLLWWAAKATTQKSFEAAMESIKMLSVEAYNYMANIPPNCWSRHAFSTIPQSNMLLNNMCESFNHVLLQARDKPILTHMEWMRKYVMVRHCKKRQGAATYNGRFMPYVTKQFEGAEEAFRICILYAASDDKFEVEYKDDIYMVDLGARKCSCYRWELTGIPCHHAYACILTMRANPEDYVHEYYSKEMYLRSYEPVIESMPGPKHWEKTPYPQPEPPPFKRMPGRPSKKRRRLELGEVTFETQNELLSRFHSGLKNRAPFSSEKVQESFHPEKESGENECNSRKSLAWDHAFFTSPGFLELEELRLMNRGFKKPDTLLSHGIEETVRSKVCPERNLSHDKPSLGAGCRLKTSMKMKVASPSKSMSIQGSSRQQTSTRRSTTMSAVVAKSHFEQINNSRKESSKSTGIMGQTRVFTSHMRKPPLRAISKSGLGLVTSKENDLQSSISVSCSQSVLPSYATNISLDFSPYETFMDNEQTSYLLKSCGTEGDAHQNNGAKEQAYSQDSYSITCNFINASQALNLEGHNSNPKQISRIKDSLEIDDLRKNVASETKCSPASSKTSSLRMPSQKIGFFDMKSETGRHYQDCIKHSNKGQRRRNHPVSFKKKTQSLEFEEKENVFQPGDTVIELQLKKGHPSSPSQLVASDYSSTTSVDHPSTSQKCLPKTQRPKRPTMLSIIHSRTPPSSTKVSPLKKSAFF